MTTTLKSAIDLKSGLHYRTTVSDANYTALSTDIEIVFTSLSAPRTVTLTPSGTPSVPKLWCVKDESGMAGTYAITLSSTSGTFDGLATTKISQNSGSKVFSDNGTNFFMESAFLPSTNASSSIQKADGDGGFKDAVAGTDYATPAAIASTYVAKTVTVDGHALSGNVTVTKGDVGLGNVANADTTTSANIIDSSGKRFVSDTNLAVLNNTSGVNTGDQNLSGLALKATTVNGHPLSSNVSVSASDVGAPSGSGTSTGTNTGDQTLPSTAQTTSTLTLPFVGAGATGTQIHATKPSSIALTVSTSATATIGGSSVSTVTLKICSTNNVTEGSWLNAGVQESSASYTLALALQGISGSKGQLYANIPAGWFVKLESSGSGTHTETYQFGWQTIYG